MHRGARAVAPEPEAGHVLFEGILDALRRNGDLLHADLVAVVERRRPAQAQQQHSGNACLGGSHPGRDARAVVIAEHPVRPAAARQHRFVATDEAHDRSRAPFGLQQREIERQMQAAQILAVVTDQAVHRQIDLADQQPQLHAQR